MIEILSIFLRSAVSAGLTVLLVSGIVPGFELGGLQALAPPLLYGLLVLVPDARLRLRPQYGPGAIVGWMVAVYLAAALTYLVSNSVAGHRAGVFVFFVAGAAFLCLACRRMWNSHLSVHRLVFAVGAGAAGALLVLQSGATPQSPAPNELGLAASVAVWQIGTALALLSPGKQHRDQATLAEV